MVPAARAGAVGGRRAVHGGDGRGRRPARARRARLGQGVGGGPFVGGHLALHVAEALPERLWGVAVDPLGSVGDDVGRSSTMRSPSDAAGRARAGARARRSDDEGAADDALALEQMRLVWRAYFAHPERAPPMPKLRMASERSAQMYPSILAELPALEAGLVGIRVPVGFVHGSQSPMPVAASTGAADRIPGAWVDVVDGAGHFLWVEAPGAVRASLRRLTALRPAPFG